MQYSVKQARLLANFTQSQVAQKLGVCEQTYRKIEKKPESATIKQAKELSCLFGVPYDNIIFCSTL